jgi:glycosyltransferase involved in cell wall biosynthesis
MAQQSERAKVRELRVAQLIGRLSVGGAEKHFVDLCNSLDVAECWAVFLGAPPEGVNLADCLDANVNTKTIRIRKRSLPTDLMRLARFLKENRIDVVHTHMFWSSLYGAIAARIAAVAAVITTEHGENRWKRAVHRFLERQVISRIASKRYCVSADILERRRDVDGIPARILAQTSNGTVIPQTAAVVRQGNSKVLGSVGRLVPQKDYPLLIDTVAELRRRGYSMHATIVGDGPEKATLLEKRAMTGMESAVDLPGMTDDVDSWLRQFDIYVVSSKEEGQPVSLLEAMAVGLPVVATDVGAISETIRDGVEGLIVPAGDVPALSDAIGRLIEEPDFARACGRAARRRIIEDFSIESVARRYECSYLDALQKPGRRHVMEALAGE